MVERHWDTSSWESMGGSQADGKEQKKCVR